GDMGELGEESAPVHEKVLRQAVGLPLEGIFLLGEHFQKARESFRDEGAEKRIRSFLNFDELQAELLEFIRKDDLIMLKGSRSMALERLSQPLLEHEG
ncbi:MAG: UDP-N-acetylmuramoylalanyl-D-glutamyl-2, 6-diaminopimelate--D-alanyl-D-alanine ligase, partial [Spirochaetales bacterium]|nr:UDP-N-acetylmuramoylalanyl-D-glutamyl-2, 6-diaminopimelate--D-alanyl-D-alanine ligase [Spirochaetales bacterium]